MSKICDRNYKDNGLYTMKTINGVGCCPSCEKPAICHGKSLEQRALYWALSGDNGSSSRALANHMSGYSFGRWYTGPPSDADDRGRCIRLLELVPEWIPRLKEMLKYDQQDEKTDAFTINSSGISAYHNSWAKQIPLILEEGKL